MRHLMTVWPCTAGAASAAVPPTAAVVRNLRLVVILIFLSVDYLPGLKGLN
jgi:hypothetical protein